MMLEITSSVIDNNQIIDLYEDNRGEIGQIEGNTGRTPNKLPGHRSPHTYSNNKVLENDW